MTPETHKQIIKTRDDPGPIYLDHRDDASDPEKDFYLAPDTTCSWAKTGDGFGTNTLRPRIEPWLTALVQSEHLSLLLGSGLTHAVHHIATNRLATGMDAIDFSVLSSEIKAEVERTAKSTGRGEGNFEDDIRVANELLRGLQILSSGDSRDTPYTDYSSSLENDLDVALQSLAESILTSERALLGVIPKRRQDAVNYLVSFLMSFASRSGTRERLHVFTTNYDRYIEVGADAAGLRLIDRFVGTLAPVFRASRLDVDLHYNPPGIRGEPRYLEGVARFTKLHGSVDWVDKGGVIQRIGLPFGSDDANPFLANAGANNRTSRILMIYPNSAKDRETSGYPYVELFRDLAAALCRPNHTLICYGYGFGDEHINRAIEDMLTIPSTHLVIIAYGDPLGRIMETYNRLGRHAQVTLLIGNHLGDLGALVGHYLPKPAIDRTTFRMADLLKARWGTEPQAADGGSGPTGTETASER